MTGLTSGWPDRARWLVGVLTGVVLVRAVVHYATGSVSAAFSDLGETVVALLAATKCALAAAASAGRLGLAWGALALASLSWAAGKAVWDWYELVLDAPVPAVGLADVGHLGFALAAVVALAIFACDLSRVGRRRMTVDGLMIACAIGLVSSATAIGAVLRASGDSAPLRPSRRGGRRHRRRRMNGRALVARPSGQRRTRWAGNSQTPRLTRGFGVVAPTGFEPALPP